MIVNNSYTVRSCVSQAYDKIYPINKLSMTSSPPAWKMLLIMKKWSLTLYKQYDIKNVKQYV